MPTSEAADPLALTVVVGVVVVLVAALAALVLLARRGTRLRIVIDLERPPR